MRVSTFFAPTLPAGMAKVRETLGPKAIVLSWRNTRGGVEISASVQMASHDIVPAKSHIQPDALADHFSPDDFTQRDLKPQSAHLKAPIGKPQTRGVGALVNRQSQTQIQQTQIRQPQIQQTQVVQRQPLPRTPVEQVRPVPQLPPSHLTKPITVSTVKGSSHAQSGILRLQAFLGRAGLTPAQAQSFGTEVTPHLQRGLIECLTAALIYTPIEAIPPKPIILVGPPGAGKSACAAKLAARTLSAGHEVLLISADAERCGGADQLKALANRLGTRFEAVSTLVDLNELVIEARQRGMVVFVDAPSASLAQPAEMRVTERMMSETRLEAILCLPADMRADDMEELARGYQSIGVRRVIATRLDLTPRRASILYVLHHLKLALAQVSATPYISGGVAIATPSRLSALLLEPFEDALAEDAA